MKLIKKLLIGYSILLLIYAAAMAYEPKLRSRPYLLLTKLGWVASPDVADLIPESSALSILFSLRSPSQKTIQEFIAALEKSMPQVTHNSKLKKEIAEKRSQLLGESPGPNDPFAVGPTSDIDGLKKYLDEAKKHRDFEASALFGFLAKENLEVQGIPGPEALRSFPAFAIFRTSYEIPISSFSLSVDEVKSAMILSLQDLAKRADAPESAVQKTAEYLRQLRFELTHSQGFPVMRVLVPDLEELPFFVTIVSRNILVIATELGLMGQILDRAALQPENPVIAELVQQVRKRTAFLSLNVDMMFGKLGQNAALGRMFLGGLSRVDLYADSDDPFQIGAVANFPNLDEAEKAQQKLEALQTQYPGPEWLQPKIEVLGKTIKAAVSVTQAKVIEYLTEALAQRSKSIARNWQIWVGTQNFLNQQKLKVAKFSQPQTGFASMKFPIQLDLNLAVNSPTLIVIPSGCPEADVSLQLTGWKSSILKSLSTSQGEKLATFPIFTTEAPKTSQTFRPNPNDIFAYVIQSDKAYQSLRLELTSASPTPLTSLCSFHFAPFVLAR